MEVLKIDWKNIESRFEKDEVYEQINAPKWMDLMAPDVQIDDVAFFCKPDCNHPKSIADFGSSPWLSKIGRFNSEVPLSPLRDQLRRRTELRNKAGVRTGGGGLLSSSVNSLSDLKSSPSLSSSATRSKGVKKPLVSRSINFGGPNAENKDPNCRPLLLNSNSNSLGALKRSATFTGGEERAMNTKPTRSCVNHNTTTSSSSNGVTRKHQHKSSSPAATPPGSERKDKEKGRQHPVLRSASSARNLFAGKDILNQISEFCTELKKLAFNAPNTSNYTQISGADSGVSTTMKSSRKASKSPICLPLRNHVSGSTPPSDGNKQRSFDLTGKMTAMKSPRQNSCNKSRSNDEEEEEEIVNGKLQRRPEWKVSGKSSSVVRSTPPTPQKFSPAVAKTLPKPKPNHKLIVNNKNNNKNENQTTKLTMEEGLGGGSIQKFNPGEEEEDASDMELCSPMKEEEEKQALDMFWFFKPCALSLYANK